MSQVITPTWHGAALCAAACPALSVTSTPAAATPCALPLATTSANSSDALSSLLNYHWLRDELLGCAPHPESTEPWARDFWSEATVTHYEDEPFASAQDAVAQNAVAQDAHADRTAPDAPLPQLATLAGTSTAAPLASTAELSELKRPATSSRMPWLLRLSLSCAVVMVLCLLGLYLQPAFAADTGTGTALPYESWLSDFQKSLTGPVAFAISLIGIVVSGISLILGGGEIRGFARTMVYIVLVMTLLIGANSLMSNFFNGAAIPMPDHTAPQVKPATAPTAASAPVVFKEQTDPAHVLKQHRDSVFIPELMALYSLDNPTFDSYQEVPWDEIARSLEEANFEGAILIEDQESGEYLPLQYHLAQR